MTDDHDHNREVKRLFNQIMPILTVIVIVEMAIAMYFFPRKPLELPPPDTPQSQSFQDIVPFLALPAETDVLPASKDTHRFLAPAPQRPCATPPLALPYLFPPVTEPTASGASPSRRWLHGVHDWPIGVTHSRAPPERLA